LSCSTSSHLLFAADNACSLCFLGSAVLLILLSHVYNNGDCIRRGDCLHAPFWGRPMYCQIAIFDRILLLICLVRHFSTHIRFTLHSVSSSLSSGPAASILWPLRREDIPITSTKRSSWYIRVQPSSKHLLKDLFS
jgi:hypothetical protein